MKRLTAILILAAILLISLCGCGGDVAESSSEESAVLSASTPPESIPGDESSADVPDKDEAFVILLRSGSFDIKEPQYDPTVKPPDKDRDGCTMIVAVPYYSALEFAREMLKGNPKNLDIIEMSPILGGTPVVFNSYPIENENQYLILTDSDSFSGLKFRITARGHMDVKEGEALSNRGKVIPKDTIEERGIWVWDRILGYRWSPAYGFYKNVGKPITPELLNEAFFAKHTLPGAEGRSQVFIESGVNDKLILSCRKEGLEVYYSISVWPRSIDFSVYFMIDDSIIEITSPPFCINMENRGDEGTYEKENCDFAWPTLESFADYGGELIYGLVDTSTESCELIRRIKAAYANAKTVPEE